MEITVEYAEKTYGTGENASGYKIELTQRKAWLSDDKSEFPKKDDWINLKYVFQPPVNGYTQSIYRDSEAGVFSANLSLTMEEAQELAHLLLYSITHAKKIKKPVKMTHKNHSEP